MWTPIVTILSAASANMILEPMIKRSRSDDGSTYAAYLLRVWRLRAEGATHWRVVLVDPQTGAEQRLDSLEALIRFLRAGAFSRPDSETVRGEDER